MKGKLVVIEGNDGSGKGTQTRLLSEWMTRRDIPHFVFDFPRYTDEASVFVRRYLNGDYGEVRTDRQAKRAALFYALDRFDASSELWKHLEADEIVLCNRYTPSTYAFQAQVGRNRTQKRAIIEWIDWLEYDLLSLPEPDLVIYLYMPHAIGQELVKLKTEQERAYIQDGDQDIHERDTQRLKRAEDFYRWLSDEQNLAAAREWIMIECDDMNGEPLPIKDIHYQVLAHLQARYFLPAGGV